MNNFFTPSIILSLGPSAEKALELTEKFLSCLPQQFRNVISYYNIEDASRAKNDIQNLIDSKLLSARNLNMLVDMGFKVRNNSTSPVKVNIYLIWDVYNSSISGYEITKLLTDMNYGNVDKDLHTGATILIISILDKEWKQNGVTSEEAVTQLKNTITHISEQDMLMAMDSKVYMLHTVSSDGSRILMEELEYICAMLIYLTVVPSEDPPLLHFKGRLIKDEGKYKIGTVGITGLTFLVDSFIEKYSRILAEDVLSYAYNSLSQEMPINYNIFKILSYESQIKKFSQLIDNMDIERDISEYNRSVKETIESELSRIIIKNGLRAGEKYLGDLCKEIEKQNIRETESFEEASPGKAAASTYSNTTESTVYHSCLKGFFSRIADKFDRRKKIDSIISEYKKETPIGNDCNKDISVEKHIDKYRVEKAVIKNNSQLLLDISQLKKDLETCIINVKEEIKKLSAEKNFEDTSGYLLISIMDLINTESCYKEHCPDIPGYYEQFINELGGYKRLKEPDISIYLIEYARKYAAGVLDKGLENLRKKIFEDNKRNEVSNWIRNGLVKAQYLLQYNCSEGLEEQTLFLTCPEFSDLVKDLMAKEYSNLSISTIDGINTYINCISIIRLCFGIDFEKISPIKNMKKHSDNI